MEIVFLLIPLGIILALVFRLAAGGMDDGRIRAYLEDQGHRVLDVSWAPFGPGWFGEKSDRIYEVRYLDRHGNEHRAYCKTSLWTGVYFTEDQIVQSAQPPTQAVDSLEEENRRLRAEIDRLRHRDEP